MDNTKQTRQLKVYSSRLHYADNYDAPCIRIEGKWLSEYGFKPGDYIAVECKDGELLIKHDEERTAALAEMKTALKDKLKGFSKKEITELKNVLDDIA